MLLAEALEDHSVSSTLDVDADQNQSCVVERRNRHSRGRHVFFNESLNVFHENTDLCLEDVESLWWDRIELNGLKSNYIQAAKNVIRAEKEHKTDCKSYNRVFERVYAACCRATAAEDDTNHDNYVSNDSTLVDISSSDQLAFRKWVSVTGNRVGLEHVVHRTIYKDKIFRRRKLYDVVSSCQDMILPPDCKSKTRNSSGCKNKNQNLEPLLALAAKEVSRPSRIFAALLGQAQAPAQL